MVNRANVALYTEQLAALDRQLAEGEIDISQHSELVAEQKRLLLVDSSSEASSSPVSDSSATSLSQLNIGRGRWLLLTSLFLVPLLALSLYQVLGANEDVEIAELLNQRATMSMGAEDAAALSQRLQRKITRRLQSSPKFGRDNIDESVFYLVTLARLQMDENNFAEAVSSYQKAVALSPNDAHLMAEYAQALYFNAGNQFSGDAGLALDNALALDPENRTALGLQGIRAFESGNYRQAVSSWQLALRAVPAGSAQAQALQSGISRAREQLGEALPSLAVTVSLSPEFHVEPGLTVYVFAREWNGMPMPLAVAKLSVKDLPVTVTLDDSMAMNGGKQLSSVETVEVVARVSMTGSAIPSEGDLEGASGALKMGDSNQQVRVVIDRQH
jgi:cytochrome c-type biogenesis protein CcmH